MLTRLLSLLKEGGTRRVLDLADELDTTPELIEAMMEDLARMGFVKTVGSQCCAKCEGCPLAGTCAAGCPASSGSAGQVWVLTEN